MSPDDRADEVLRLLATDLMALQPAARERLRREVAVQVGQAEYEARLYAEARVMGRRG